jgi:RNA polymerase sigma-70 factor (ECF subfamily)
MMSLLAAPLQEYPIRMIRRQDTRTWFSRCVEVNMDSLYGVALRLTRDRADAEDLVAETVIRAWTAIDSLADRERLRPWLFRIMHNHFISHCRKQSARPVESTMSELAPADDDGDITSLLLDQPDEFLVWWANPEKRLMDQVLGEQIRAAIAGLPEAFRMVILLVNGNGLTYDEAAEVLGVPTGTVRSRMKRGRTLLQKALWEQAKEAGLTSGKHVSEQNT